MVGDYPEYGRDMAAIDVHTLLREGISCSSNFVTGNGGLLDTHIHGEEVGVKVVIVSCFA